MDPLARSLPTLRVRRYCYLMLDFLYEDFIFMAFYINIPYRIGGVRICSDQALCGAFNDYIGGCWHGSFSCVHVDKTRAPKGGVAIGNDGLVSEVTPSLIR